MRWVKRTSKPQKGHRQEGRGYFCTVAVPAHPLEILLGEEFVPKLLGRDVGRRGILLLLFHLMAVDITTERVAVAATAAAAALLLLLHVHHHDLPLPALAPLVLSPVSAPDALLRLGCHRMID